MNIAAARAEDLPAIRGLLAACGLPHDDFRDGAVSFLVAREGDAVRGVAGLEPLGATALLRSVAVQPAHRRHGLARSLCEKLFEHARGAGTRRLFLLTTTTEPYFRRLGFSTVERSSLPPEVRATSEFSVACPETAIAMTKEL